MQPQFLAIGHLAHDRTPTGCRWGGAATYAALTAARLGVPAAMVTAGAFSEGDLRSVLKGVEVICKPSPTTTFAHRYHRGLREQTLLSRAPPLHPEDVPERWRRVPLVLLCPIAQEFSPTLVRYFPYSCVGVGLQGWLRSWDTAGHVQPQPWWDEEGILSQTQAALLSREDVRGNEAIIAFYAARAPLLVVTEAEAGARLHTQGQWELVPAFPAMVQDPTGAGDAFAAALLIALSEGHGALEAARFASCVASFVVEGLGTSTIPTRAEVEHRLQETHRPAR